MLNRQWRQESSTVELYAHHLSRCPSFALSNNVITGPFRSKDLARLKAKFAAEVRRNLFEAFLRPRTTVVNLISVSANSSTAFPGGEAFRFTFSPNGQTVLALSSSRIDVLDTTSDPIKVRRELRTTRKVLTASVTDDGSLLAALSSKYVVNIYALTPDTVQHLQVIVLEQPPRAICLAHQGTVLAAAYHGGGVEVFSLAANALRTDRRAVRCEAVDCLDFSGDSSMLIGSSRSPDDPNAVVISAPFYAEPESNASPREVHSRQWTTQILFPNNSATCSHATLIPNHIEGDAAWLFAFDHILTTYRAVRTDDTRTGVAYFLSPPSPRRYSALPFPSMPPSVSGCGDLVAVGFQNVGLCVYGIPQRLDVSPDMGSVVERYEDQIRGPMALTTATGNVEPLMAYSPSVSGSSESIEEDPLASRVDWRASLFVKCRHINVIGGVTAIKWVEQPETQAASSPGRRLLAVAPGGVSSLREELGDESMPVDGSRLVLLDFNYSPAAGKDQEITIEVGVEEPELLPEQQGNFENDLAIERHRSVRDPGRRNYLGRSASSITPPIGVSIDSQLRRGSASQPSSPVDRFLALPDIATSFSQSQPRSQDILHRAATAAGFYNARFPPRPPLGLAQESNNGRRESNDSWVTPPPPYSSGGSPANRARRSENSLYTPSSQLQLDHPQMPSQTDTLSAIQASMHIPMPPASYQQPSPQQSPPIRHFTDPAQRVGEPISPPRRSSTTPEPSIAPISPVQRFSPPLGPIPRSQRGRNFTDTSLETVKELTNLQGAVNFLPGSSTVVSPISLEDPHVIRRRPVGESNRHMLPHITMPAVTATLTHPISPPTPDRSPQELIEDSSSIPTITETSIHERTVSLTGANLKDRLNRPVPPVPGTEQQIRDHPGYVPPRLQVGQPARPELLPPNPNAEPFAQMNGQNSQAISTMHHQEIRESPRPSLNLPNGAAVSLGWARTMPSPQSTGGFIPNGIPRQESNSPTFIKNLQVPMSNGMVRSTPPPGSAGSGISPMLTQSTPNLSLYPQWSHAQQQQGYPPYQHVPNLSYDWNGGNMTAPPPPPWRMQSAYSENHQAYSGGNGEDTGSGMGISRRMTTKRRKEKKEKGGGKCVVM